MLLVVFILIHCGHSARQNSVPFDQLFRYRLKPFYDFLMCIKGGKRFSLFAKCRCFHYMQWFWIHTFRYGSSISLSNTYSFICFHFHKLRSISASKLCAFWPIVLLLLRAILWLPDVHLSRKDLFSKSKIQTVFSYTVI